VVPLDLVDFVDEPVAAGDRTQPSCADPDAEILARTGPDPELAGLAEYATRLTSELD
jgi:hypothetical protein